MSDINEQKTKFVNLFKYIEFTLFLINLSNHIYGIFSGFYQSIQQQKLDIGFWILIGHFAFKSIIILSSCYMVFVSWYLKTEHGTIFKAINFFNKQYNIKFFPYNAIAWSILAVSTSQWTLSIIFCLIQTLIYLLLSITDCSNYEYKSKFLFLL